MKIKPVKHLKDENAVDFPIDLTENYLHLRLTTRSPSLHYYAIGVRKITEE